MKDNDDFLVEFFSSIGGKDRETERKQEFVYVYVGTTNLQQHGDGIV